MFYVKKHTRIIEMLVRNIHTYVLKCDIHSDYVKSEFIYSKKKYCPKQVIDTDLEVH